MSKSLPFFVSITKHLQAKSREKPSKNHNSTFYQDRIDFAREVLFSLVKRMDALFHKGDFTYAERLGGIGYKPSSPEEAARAATEWERFNRDELQAVFDEILADGWVPTLHGDIVRAINYAWAMCFFYEFIAPKIPAGRVHDKMAFALAQIGRLSALVEWRVDATGRALPGNEARKRGKREQSRRTAQAVLVAFESLGDASAKMKPYALSRAIADRLDKETRCDPKTVWKHLKSFGKI